MDSKQSQKQNINAQRKMGTFGLTMIIVSAMIGGGAFNIPQNMSADAGTGANLIAWCITAAGMWFLANMFRILSEARPEATNGIYTYGQLGFGNLTGFISAWGYWVAGFVGHVAYAVLLMSTFNYFFPGIFTGGNNIWSILVGSAIFWMMFGIVMRGVKGVNIINIIGTISKLLPLVFFIITVCVFFRIPQFIDDFWGIDQFTKADGRNPAVSIFKQVSNSMLITLWMYIGIEGAVVVSGRATSQKAVSRATVSAFVLTTALYILISILPNGVFSAPELGGMAAPSTGEILQRKIGVAGMYIMNIGLIISLLSSWLVWTIVTAELPYTASQSYTFPKIFKRTNKRGAASNSLLITACTTQVILILSYFSKNAWTFLLSVTGTMVMPCYLICIMYLLKVAFDKKEAYPKIFASRRTAKSTGVLAGIYGVYLIYAAGLNYMLIACIFYAIGIPVFASARKQDPNNNSKKVFSSKGELIFSIILILAGVGGLIYTILEWKTVFAG